MNFTLGIKWARAWHRLAITSKIEIAIIENGVIGTERRNRDAVFFGTGVKSRITDYFRLIGSPCVYRIASIQPLLTASFNITEDSTITY